MLFRVDGLRVIDSARKHGFADDDLFHALRNILRVIPEDGLIIYIGPAQDGTVLEVGVVADDEDERVVHAMKARRKYWH